MNHEEARERMLTAAMAELRGEGRGGLAEHLRSCASCRQLAAGMLADLAALDDVLRSASAPAAEGTGRRRPAGRRALSRVAAAAAAAVLALLLLRPGRAPERHIPLLAPAATPDVSAPSERPYAVLQTSNPDIRVVWFF